MDYRYTESGSPVSVSVNVPTSSDQQRRRTVKSVRWKAEHDKLGQDVDALRSLAADQCRPYTLKAASSLRTATKRSVSSHHDTVRGVSFDLLVARRRVNICELDKSSASIDENSIE